VLDLPDAVLLHVVVGVSCLHDVAGGSHGELVNTSIRSPSVSDVDLPVEDLPLRLLEEEGVEVILDAREVGAGLVGDRGEEDGRLGVTARHDARVAGGEGGVPQFEERPHLGLGDVALPRLGVELLGLAEEVEGGDTVRDHGSVHDSGDAAASDGGEAGVGREPAGLGEEGEGDGEGGELHCGTTCDLIMIK